MVFSNDSKWVKVPKDLISVQMYFLKIGVNKPLKNQLRLTRPLSVVRDITEDIMNLSMASSANLAILPEHTPPKGITKCNSSKSRAGSPTSKIS